MLSRLQLAIHYTFKQVKWLEQALTHSSFVNEYSEGLEHNERLEFLGDAVLELSVSEMLFRFFPQAREGELTALRSGLVSQGALAEQARRLGLDKALRLGRGEESQGGRSRDALLSDAFEAVLGAVFMDGGYEEAAGTVVRLIENLVPASGPRNSRKDSKSILQELTQRNFRELPVYSLKESRGPEHAKIFEVLLRLPDGRVFTGTGSSLKRAEQIVAMLALEEFERE